MSRLKLGMAQILVEGGQPDANLTRAENAIKQAATQCCRLVVLPECLDLGWCDDSAQHLAQPIPGPHYERIANSAAKNGVYVAAGMVERYGQRIYNAAVLVGPTGQMVLHYRKINELDIARPLYSVGDRLGVSQTDLGTIGLNICADNFSDSLAISHVLCRMGAQIIVSPCAWAVDANHDNAKQPYGKLWLDSYTELANLYGVTVVGVSNVGRISSGPWKNRKCIGCSLAVGPGGRILAQGPYGVDAEAMITVDVSTRPPIAEGTDFASELQDRGYRGI